MFPLLLLSIERGQLGSWDRKEQENIFFRKENNISYEWLHQAHTSEPLSYLDHLSPTSVQKLNVKSF